MKRSLSKDDSIKDLLILMFQCKQNYLRTRKASWNIRKRTGTVAEHYSRTGIMLIIQAVYLFEGKPEVRHKHGCPRLFTGIKKFG